MHHDITRKLALTIVLAAAVGGSSIGDASAATLAHHAGYAVASAKPPAGVTPEDPSTKDAEEVAPTPVQPSTRNCIREHLSHGHC